MFMFTFLVFCVRQQYVEGALPLAGEHGGVVGRLLPVDALHQKEPPVVASVTSTALFNIRSRAATL